MFGLLNKIFKISFTVLLINISFGQENIVKNLSFKVDSLINSSINEKAFPGGQVYVKIGDEIVINKSFGYHTYDSIVKVENDHVYDLASLTKVLASTLSIMKISEDYNLDLNEP
ncbi:beta-lactamase family protein, partial [Flavobacteriaceae bacterium]|nr:beta-lactamase family protein [Flavobacteriaceae bacterium]